MYPPDFAPGEPARQLEPPVDAAAKSHETLFESAGFGVVYQDGDGRIVDANAAAQEILGLTLPELRGRTWRDRGWNAVREDGSPFPGDEHPSMHVLRTGEASRGTLMGISRGAERDRRWVVVDSFPQTLPGTTRPCRIVTTFDDVSASRQVERRLEESESHLRHAAAAGGVGLWDWDLVTNAVFYSPEWKRQIGYEDHEIGNEYREWEERVHPDDLGATVERIQRYLERPVGVHEVVFRFRHKDGSYRWILTQASVECDANGRPVRMLGSHVDITERRQLEAQLRQAQKLEAIGQLAGGVAHDFNNILAATMMHIELLLTKPTLDDETREGLRDLTKDAERAAELTRQLLILARRSVLTTKPLDLNDVVSGLLKMLRRVIGEPIELSFDSKGGLPAVEADRILLEQVLMNLVVNARDAMPHGGRITITTTLRVFDALEAYRPPTRRPGPFVCLTVTDAGGGMDEATVSRIFEPFFTTKPVGTGSGLGLATVHGIVAQHQGWIEVESVVGSGSTFNVFLPAATAPMVDAAEQVDETVPRGGGETVLLVEDEATLLETAARALARLGYRVVTAANGPEATRRWAERDGHIDVLFTDMVMPNGMTGLDLSQRLRAEDPSLATVISSGYSAEMVEAGIPRASGVVYLPKPYTLKGLAGAIRESLGR